ncbi:LamG-like jellyroll fold domain-containing protein [Streptomyces anulatus]
MDGTRTVLSQDAGTARAFTLGLTPAGSRPAWSFSVGGARVAGGLPEAGDWAYVLGQYDAETGTVRLYVNGREVGEETAAVPVAGEGDFQIGRARGVQGYRDRWQGEIGDVRAFDRIVVPGELTALATRTALRVGHWALDSAPGGLSPETGGGVPLKLGAGAPRSSASTTTPATSSTRTASRTGRWRATGTSASTASRATRPPTRPSWTRPAATPSAPASGSPTTLRPGR